jgi:MoaA/NifB/PqqE/SkfB family radical SAM enzyme
LDRRRCLTLCDELVKADFGLGYHAHSRIDTLDEEVVARLVAAGFEELYIGLESGSPAVLQRLRKGINVEKVRAMVPVLRRHNLAFRLSLIFWTPDETIDEAIETIELLRELEVGIDQLTISYGIDIYPGTAEAERFLRRFPGYRWLERCELGHGYRQVCDSQGNVIGVSHRGATYAPERLEQEINQRLAARLRASGERDYKKLKYAIYTTDLMAARLGGLDGVRGCAERFLRTLDEQGAPWGLCGDGHFNATVLGEVVKAGRFANFAGRFPVREIPNTREVEVEGNPEHVEYLVLAYTVNDGRSNAVANHLFDTRRFAGILLLPAQVLLALDGPDGLRHVARHELLKRATFIPKYRPTMETGRLAVPQAGRRHVDRAQPVTAVALGR